MFVHKYILYRNAYNLVLRKHAERLYADVQAVVREHLQERVVDGQLACAYDPMDLLTALRQQWQDFRWVHLHFTFR